jgi:hypothetical protein
MNIAVANIVRNLTLGCVIRSRGEAGPEDVSDAIAHGIEFIAPAANRRLLLRAYVYAQIGSEEIIGS